jgi:hypothetical protein
MGVKYETAEGASYAINDKNEKSQHSENQSSEGEIL